MLWNEEALVCRLMNDLLYLKIMDFIYFIFLSYFHFILCLFSYLRLKIRVSVIVTCDVTRLLHYYIIQRKLEKVLE